ncbi:hypothetical protein F5Y18DRAFT_420213 [Xylariaceae sp. FL1019]|nr:hypothetical protein F5Y18DRAFT_420213 [Xylariaceae sp. FL1019]
MPQLTEISSNTRAERPKPHCWECLRRRLVCDSVQPACDRCRNNGIDEKRPLRWVKPGQVTARNRRQPKSSGGSAREGKSSSDLEKRSGTEFSTTPTVLFVDESDNETRKHRIGGLNIFGAMQSRALDKILQFDITSEDSSACQASYYYNVEVYERCSPLKLLLEDQRVQLPTTTVYALLPEPLKCLFILTAMAHQAHRLPQNADREVVQRSRSALAHWTYQSVQTLNQDITNEETRITDGTITSVFVLMSADQQLYPSTRWRIHWKGMAKMIELRGGLEKVWDQAPNLQIGILCVILAEAFGNSTSPSDDQLSDFTNLKTLEFLKRYMGSICPPALFFDVIRINHIRARAKTGVPTGDTGIYADARAALDSVLAFPLEKYVEDNGNASTHNKWLLITRIHHSAVILYCILSLQYFNLLPRSQNIERIANERFESLLLDLKEAYRHRNFKNCLIWCLAVAGTRAVTGTSFERAFLVDLLNGSRKDIGSFVPIYLRNALTTFWDSGKRRWEDCWDRPYFWMT